MGVAALEGEGVQFYFVALAELSEEPQGELFNRAVVGEPQLAIPCSGSDKGGKVGCFYSRMISHA